MAQRYRTDHADAWLHVVNRGIARRATFPSRQLVEAFLDLIGQEVEAGWIEVHAYSAMTTHFHLLVRSPRGEAYRALMHAQNVYARTFNRAARRDGPLFRGRFHSTYVASEVHWRNVVRYIDFNPVDARMSASPGEHPFGSACAYMGGAAAPWLARDVVESVVRGDTGETVASPGAYARIFGRTPTDAERHCVEARLGQPAAGGESLDDLVGVAPESVREWMYRKALVADGTAAARPLLRTQTVLDAIAAAAAAQDGRLVTIAGRRRSVLPILRAGLLRTTTGASWSQIAEVVGVSTPAAHGNGAAHVRLLLIDATYADLCADVIAAALRTEWPAASSVRLGAVPMAVARSEAPAA